MFKLEEFEVLKTILEQEISNDTYRLIDKEQEKLELEKKEE